MGVVENEEDRNAKQFVCWERPLLSQLRDPVCFVKWILSNVSVNYDVVWKLKMSDVVFRGGS